MAKDEPAMPALHSMLLQFQSTQNYLLRYYI